MFVDFDRIDLDIRKDAYPIIGVGSGRIVYDLENGYVVKAAKNRRGIAQNKVENHIDSVDHSDIFAKVMAVSENYEHLIMEKAEKIRDTDDICKYYNVRSMRELFRTDKFRYLSSDYGLLYPDLYRRSSWGILRDKPVIVDYGFTREVKRLYTRF